MLPPQTILKTLQNYISEQVVSLKLLISSGILKSSLEKFTASLTCFKHLDSNNNMSDDLLNQNLLILMNSSPRKTFVYQKPRGKGYFDNTKTRITTRTRLRKNITSDKGTTLR